MPSYTDIDVAFAFSLEIAACRLFEARAVKEPSELFKAEGDDSL